MSGAALPAHAAATARSRGGSSRPLRRRLSVPRAGGAAAPAPAPPPPLPGAFDDDALPDSLYDAVVQAASCSAAAVSAGERNLLVELNVPELFDTTSGNIMAQPGDQQRAWELCREFVEQLRAALDLPPSSPARALFPDAGAAAMLASRWAGRGFEVGSLRGASRTAGIGGTATSAAGAAHSPGDGLLVVCCPDPQGAEAARAAARAAAEDGVPVVLLNPRLASGDAGIGLSARRLKDEFLGKLTVAYSLRPVGDGTGAHRSLFFHPLALSSASLGMMTSSVANNHVTADALSINPLPSPPNFRSAQEIPWVVPGVRARRGAPRPLPHGGRNRGAPRGRGPGGPD